MYKIGMALIATALATCLLIFNFHQSDSNLENQFYNFMIKYDKSYSSESEFAYRFEIYKQNMLSAEYQNRLNSLAKFGETKFSDMNREEVFRNQVIKNVQQNIEMVYPNKNGIESQDHRIQKLLNTSIDWRNYTNPIMDQGAWGACWAFSAAATFEARRTILGYEKKKFSEQELVDCVGNWYGCIGGLDNFAYDWLKDFDFWEAKDYPYVEIQGYCNCSICHTNATDSGAKFVEHTEVDMLRELNNGPISIGVDATSWMSYMGGILTDCGNSITHAAVIVGYGQEKGTAYWLVRNSFGAEWGEEGYIKLKYGNNTWNLTFRPCYPLFY